MLNLSNADLINKLTLLADFVGRVDSSTLDTVFVGSLAKEDIEANDTLCILSGDTINTDIAITDFDSGEITFEAIETPIAIRSIIAICKIGFDNYIANAYEVLKNDLKNKNVDINLFLTEWQLKQLHIYKTLELICGDRRNGADTNDAYNANFERFGSLYSSELVNFVADYDANEDGSISDAEELIFKGQVGFIR